MSLLQIENLKVSYRTRDGSAEAVNIDQLEIRPSEIFGLVGESGCGKSTLAKSILRLLPPNAEVKQGRVLFKGQDVLALPEKTFNRLRWQEIAVIPQGSMNALDPVYTVRQQIAEALNTKRKLAAKDVSERVDELMDLVGMQKRRADDYPHQLSGGMRQRAMIAMALALHPALIIADEPTTALDVMMQDRILSKIYELCRRFQLSLLIITHDISVVAELCDRMGVMYAGEIVEVGSVNEVFDQPGHPYTIGLQNAFPSVRGNIGKLMSIPGSPPDLSQPLTGCKFRFRCPWRQDLCAQGPKMRNIKSDHFSRCHLTSDIQRFRREGKNAGTWREVEILDESGI